MHVQRINSLDVYCRERELADIQSLSIGEASVTAVANVHQCRDKEQEELTSVASFGRHCDSICGFRPLKNLREEEKESSWKRLSEKTPLLD